MSTRECRGRARRDEASTGSDPTKGFHPQPHILHQTPPKSISLLSTLGFITSLYTVFKKALEQFLKRLKPKSVDMACREAAHAGSWYSVNKRELSSQLDSWLKAVPAKVEYIGTFSSKQPPVELPLPGARAIIAP